MPAKVTSGMQPDEITPHLFRTEYTKIVAVLCRTFRLKQIEIAEDIASETFLKASEYWAQKGIPENPTAWLYTVAKNKAKDYFKRLGVFETDVKNELVSAQSLSEQWPRFEFDDKSITDSQLEMMFAVCDPVNSAGAQICLSLQLLCGFSVVEIANAFLSKTETIKKRLARARQSLRESHFKLKSLSADEIKSRLHAVLKTLYLLFNEGYFSRTDDQIIRKDLCLEAIRLTLILTNSPLTDTREANALLALMCFQSSRLDARKDQEGQVILFDQQDKNLWDQDFIQKGNYYLIQAYEKDGFDISKYHLEAAIAYWHTATTELNKWQHILQLYNQLITVEYSVVTALNRAFVYSKLYGAENAICEVEKLDLQGNEYYHGLLGYLYCDINIEKAIRHYEQAIRLTKSKPEKQTLQKQLETLRRS